MEVRIGVRNVAREVVLETDQDAAAVEKTVSAAIAKGSGVISLTDDKGRQVIVPVEALGYVDIAAEQKSRVGFGVS